MRKVFSFLFFLLFAHSYSAGGEGIKLDLNKSIELALENNNSLRQVKFDKEIAEKLVNEAYGNSLFPSIDGSVNYNRALKQALIFIETPFFSGSFPAGTKNTLTGSVAVEQPLFTGAMFLAVKIAKTYAEIAEENVINSELEITNQVKEAYYNILLANELEELGELNLDLSSQNLSNAQSLFDAGLVSEYDLLKAKVQYQNVIPAVTEVKNQHTLAKNALKILLGMEISRSIEIEDSLELKNLYIPEFEEGLQILFENNRLLKQLELDILMKDYTSSYEFSQHLPTLNLNGAWQAQAQENDDKPISRWFFSNSLFVGLTLKVPIFKGFSISSKVEQAEIQLLKSEEEFNNTKRILQNEYESNILNINKTLEQIKAYELSVKESFRGYEIAVKRFNAGLGTQLEVTNALFDFTQSKVNYLTSLRDYYIYHSRLEYVLGVHHTQN